MEVGSARKNPESISCSSSTSPWYDLSNDLAILILELLPLSDYIRFACVCQKWRSIQKYHRRLHSPNPPPMLKSFPWLISTFNRPNQNTLQVYSHSDSKIIHLNLPNSALENQSFFWSKGWIFLIDVRNRLSLLNPLTNFLIQLPPMYITPFQFSGELSASPLDPNCIALIFNSTTDLVYFCRVGEKQGTWTSISFSNNRRHCHGHHSVMAKRGVFYCNDKFYCVANDLCVIDPSSNKLSRRILNMDCSEMAAMLQIHFLVEFRGELLIIAAIYDIGPTDFQVFKADFSTNKWRRMNDVADLVFFVSKNRSLCLSASDVGCKGNCVYYKDEVIGNKSYRVFDLDSKQWGDGPPFDYADWFLPSLDIVPQH